MANLEKWVDELQAAVDKLTKRVANAAASAFKPEIETPTDGQLLIYDATAGKWVNGDAPEQYTISAGTELPASPEHEGDIFFLTTEQNTISAIYTALDISDTLTWVEASQGEPELGNTFDIYKVESGAGSVGCVALISEDGTTAFNTAYVRLKSGSGTFKSYVISDYGFPADAFDSIEVGYTFQGSDVDQTVALSALSLTSGHKYNFGVYYRSDNNGCYVGVIYSDAMTPQNFQLYQISSGTGSSGNIDVSKIKLTKTVQTRKTTKKGGTK